ncbi:dihydrofolate reductase [Byssothecium circinans]|uniref:Dihydrofolate reductase n=1 Tax=Byssothecium circinans TaxID=147558 RepID=A0A6A5U7R9_9PLEO|nr:dihydrofolate reductase [Byssothecium circinans]
MPRRSLTFLPQNIRLLNLRTLIRYRIMAQAAPPKRPIKVLMLHGFTQSGPSFHAKTRALEKNLQKAFPAGITLSYPTAPLRLAPADIPFPLPSQSNGDSTPEEVDAWAWWRRKGDREPYTFEGIEQGLERIAEVLKTEGPFDGVIGFSQGGACAAMLASLLEPGRREAFEKFYSVGGMSYPSSFESDTGYMESVIHPPLKFAVSYSGFVAGGVDTYRGFYEPKIKTPMLHFLGTLDAVVEEKRSLALVERCEESEGRVVYHPGGHFLPSSQKAYVGALVGFMKEVLDKAENGEKNEESVEYMDVPF